MVRDISIGGPGKYKNGIHFPRVLPLISDRSVWHNEAPTVMFNNSGGSWGGAPPLFWVKKEEMTEGKMAAMASKSRPPPPPPLRRGYT